MELEKALKAFEGYFGMNLGGIPTPTERRMLAGYLSHQIEERKRGIQAIIQDGKTLVEDSAEINELERARAALSTLRKLESSLRAQTAALAEALEALRALGFEEYSFLGEAMAFLKTTGEETSASAVN